MGGTLYLSDLDGTLLRPDATLDPEDARRINLLTAAGVKITFATARTVRSVKTILAGIDFTNPGAAPVALMNGTMIRDMARGVYTAVEKIPAPAAEAVLRTLDRCGGEPFVYTVDPAHPVDGDPLLTSCRRLANGAMERFMEERIRKYGKPFLRFRDAGDLSGEPVYFCVLDGEAAVRRMAAALEGTPGVRLTFYPDAYAPGVWYLEIFPETASKRHAVEFLRAYTGCGRVVAFGDNRNDLPMFEAADTAVAVENASAEVRAAADGVTSDVVGWIARRAGFPRRF